MSDDDRLVVRREGDLARLTLNDPERANALSPRLIEELTAAYRHPWLAEGVRAIVLDAAGKNFSAGADLEHLRTLRDAGREQNLADSLRLRDLFAAVLRQEAYTVALVQGACVAGGCGLATAHDCVIASEDARFMYSEVRIGFVAALVATFLPLRVRGRDARELLLDPDFIGAERALAIGLVDRVASRQHLETEGLHRVATVLEKASSQSIAMSKRLMLDIVGLPLAEAMDRAAEVNAAARATDDCKRGIDAFLETKKTPNWR